MRDIHEIVDQFDKDMKALGVHYIYNIKNPDSDTCIWRMECDYITGMGLHSSLGHFIDQNFLADTLPPAQMDIDLDEFFD